MPAIAAPPDAALRNAVKASIEVGVTWLRWQMDREGTWRGDVFATAGVLRVFGENFRKYVEDDGPYMSRPAAYLRRALQHPKNAIVTGAAVLALRPLNNPADDFTPQAAVLKRWIADAATAVRPIDLEQLALMVSAARTAGVPAHPELQRHVEVLVLHGSTNGPIPGFREALAMYAQLAAGAPKDHPAVEEHLEALRGHWGWWADRTRVAKAGYPVVPPRFWYAVVRALDAHGSPTIVDAAGTPHDWKAELARAIVAAQHADGYWLEQEDTIGDTVAAVSALELIYRQ
jgi:hypothetical protein